MRYKQTILGVAWVILQTLMAASIGIMYPEISDMLPVWWLPVVYLVLTELEHAMFLGDEIYTCQTALVELNIMVGGVKQNLISNSAYQTIEYQK